MIPDSLDSAGFTINMLRYVSRREAQTRSVVVNGSNRLRNHVDSTYALGYVFGVYASIGLATLVSNSRGQVFFRPKEGIFGVRRKLLLANHLRDSFNLRIKFRIRSKRPGKEEAIVHCRPLAKLFYEFGKRQERHIPDKYLVKNPPYLKGLIDGIEDYKGHYRWGKSFYPDVMLCYEFVKGWLTDLGY